MNLLMKQLLELLQLFLMPVTEWPKTKLTLFHRHHIIHLIHTVTQTFITYTKGLVLR